MATIARHVRIVGRVQGVFFRAWSVEQANELGVTGWVRNCPDAHVEGDERAVEQMIERLRRGPPAAQVEDVRLWDVEPCEFEGFEVRH